MKSTVIAFLSLFSVVSFAYEKTVDVDMEGIIKIWGKSSIETEIPGFSVFISDESAKELYMRMNTQAVLNECFDDGTLTKRVGNFECSYNKEYKYSCSVGIGLKDQKLYAGESC